MPTKSAKQTRFMYAVKSGKVPGVNKQIGEDFIKDTPAKKRSSMMKGKKRSKKRKKKR